MNGNLINYISYSLYGLFLIGIIVAFYDCFIASIQNYMAQAIVVQNFRKESKPKSPKTELSVNEYLRDILSIVYRRPVEMEQLINFYGKCVIVGLISFAACTMLMSIGFGVIGGGLGTLLPVFFLWAKFEEIRNEASREGEILVTELYQCYKLYSNNMLEAIRRASMSLSDEAPHSKHMLIELSHELNTSITREAKKRAIDKFRFGINTTWASNLAINLELDLLNGFIVSSAMEDLIQTIIKARKTMEETKRQGNEGNRMLRLLAPMMYVITLILALSFFDFTLEQYFYNQFRTNLGSILWMLMVMTYLGSLIISRVIAKSKMDT